MPQVQIRGAHINYEILGNVGSKGPWVTLSPGGRRPLEGVKHLAERVAADLRRDPSVARETHAREELGLDPKEGLGSPIAAALSSFATFSVGALVPLAPFLAFSGATAERASAGLSAVALFGVGAVMATLTGRSVLLSGLRMLAIGAAATAVTFLIGNLLGVAIA